MTVRPIEIMLVPGEVYTPRYGFMTGWRLDVIYNKWSSLRPVEGHSFVIKVEKDYELVEW